MACTFSCVTRNLCVPRSGCDALGEVSQDSEFFRWLSAVTYAMVAALTIRLIFLPIGLLATVPLYLRVLVCILALGVMLSNPNRRLVPALLTGTLLMVTIGVML